jgi:hypothetical protein
MRAMSSIGTSPNPHEVQEQPNTDHPHIKTLVMSTHTVLNIQKTFTFPNFPQPRNISSLAQKKKKKKKLGESTLEQELLPDKRSQTLIYVVL